MNDKNRFENNAFKQLIRENILEQFQQFVSSTSCLDNNNFAISTLCGENWYFERLLVWVANHAFPNRNFDLYTAERNPAIQNNPFSPIGADSVNGPTTIKRNVAIIYSDGFCFRPGESGKQFVWADFCGYPTRKIFRALSEFSTRGVLYVTFCTRWRVKGSIAPQIRNAPGDTNEEKIINAFEKVFTSSGTKFTRIFTASYIGGINSPMITVGWQFGPNTILPVKLNHQKTHRPPNRKRIYDIERVKSMLAESSFSDSEIMARAGCSKMQLAGVKAALARRH
jgi:hypothetical protein